MTVCDIFCCTMVMFIDVFCCHWSGISLDPSAPWSLFSKKGDASQSVKASLQGGLEGLIQAWVTDNDTQAKLLGRADGQRVLSYLQAEGVAENLCYEDFDEAESSGSSSGDKFKSRLSFIAEKIVVSVIPQQQ